MEENKEKKFEEKMEALRMAGLERQTLELLKTTHWGRIYAGIYFLIGIGSIFVYKLIFKFNVIFSIFLGILMWFFVSFIVDKILIKTQRIDEQLNWLLETPAGLAELKRRGMTDEQIEKFKSEIKNDPLYKKFSLENYKK
jgi:mannitol-specific phosphotransferase system IIBC component